VVDSATGEPLGMFYLDMFPREGKFNHFAQFDIISGKLLPNGKYQRPTVALLCNFPPANGDTPSLMTHQDVETLFHEFGHALHSIVTRAKYGRFAGTHVPGDFVEAPSQMLQNWVWDKKVLDTFAGDYRDPSKKIPAEIVKKMNDAKLANAGVFYRRQFAFASLDLALHDPHPEDMPYDCVAISNPILEKVFLPIDRSTTFVSYFGHLNGYDAGYYGYAWADAIAADMATVFEKAKDGYLDKQAGMKLRREIYEPGDSRDVNVSIEKFLGRKQSVEPFLKKIGIGSQEKKKPPAGPSQEFEGRSPGTKGEELSVKYIADQFKKIELKPGNPDETYTQEVPLAGIKSEPRMSFTIADKTMDLKYPDDFVASSARLQPEIKIDKADVVFVGYGVVAPEYGWNDYKNVDVRGKTLLMLIGDPPVPDPKDPSKLDDKMFKGKAMTYYGRWTYKHEIAAQKGAAAAIIIHETEPAAYPWQVVKSSWGKENFELDNPNKNMDAVSARSWITLDVAKKLLADCGQNFDAL